MQFIPADKAAEIHGIQAVVFGALIGSGLSNFGSINSDYQGTQGVLINIMFGIVFIILIFISSICAHFSYHVLIKENTTKTAKSFILLGIIVIPVFLFIMNYFSASDPKLYIGLLKHPLILKKPNRNNGIAFSLTR
jgi:hypothetical protein